MLPSRDSGCKGNHFFANGGMGFFLHFRQLTKFNPHLAYITTLRAVWLPSAATEQRM